MSKRMVQTGVEEWQEEEVQTGVEDRDSASDEPEQACRGEQVERMPNIVQEWLNNHINCTGVLKAQKAQAMKQARHWQAACKKREG